MNFSNYKLPIVIIAIILFGGAGFLFFMGSKYQKPKTPPAVSAPTRIPATPTPLPMSSESANPELQNADVQIEAALKNAEADLNTINKIDTSDETTTGL